MATSSQTATNYQKVTVVSIMDYILDLSQLMDYTNYLFKLRDISMVIIRIQT
jgi:hypothetical protein